MGRPKGGARGAARRNDGLGCAGSDLGHRPFFGQTGAPLFLFLQEKYRLAGLPKLPFAKRPRASRARRKRIRIKLLRFLYSRSGKQVENRRAKAGRQQISAPAGLGPNESRIYGFMKRSGQEASPTWINREGTRGRAAPWLLCQERRDRQTQRGRCR